MKACNTLVMVVYSKSPGLGLDTSWPMSLLGLMNGVLYLLMSSLHFNSVSPREEFTLH